DLAAQAFEQARAIDPASLPPSVAIGEVELPDRSDEIEQLKTALAEAPADSLLHGKLGRAYYGASEYERALVELGCAVDGCATSSDTVEDPPGAPELVVAPLPLTV